MASNRQNGQPPLQILRLSPQINDHWRLFPVVLDRVREFLVRFSLPSPPEVVCQYLRTYWAAGSDTVALWVVLRGLTVVGHCIGVMEQSWGIPYAMVMQLELTTGVTATREKRQEMLAEIDHWARSQQATSMKMLAMAPPEVWGRLAGFTLDKYLMLRQLSKE